MENLTARFLGSDWTSATLLLDDVQPLWGGRRVAAHGTGRWEILLVARGSRAERRLTHDDPAAVRTLLQLAVRHDLLRATESERAGLPDEARLSVTLVNGAGERQTRAKWAGEEVACLDPIYSYLLAYVANLTS